MTTVRDRPYRYLAYQDVVLARLASRYGHPEPFDWRETGRTQACHFAAVVLRIVAQSISARAAFTIFDRISASTEGVPTPESVLAVGVDRLRRCGLSHAKAGYIFDLAQAQKEGRVDLERMTAYDNDQVITALTAIRGVGLLSAQLFLIHQLRRPDVLPASDINLRRAVQHVWRLQSLPTVDEVCQRAAAWAPYRTYAATLLWRSLGPMTPDPPGTLRPWAVGTDPLDREWP